MTESLVEPSDDELLARSVPGDRSAFAMLVKRHEATIRRTTGGLLAWSCEVPDAVQDVWMTAWRRRTSFAGRSTVKTWLTGIAIQVCRNRRRSRWFRRKTTQLEEPFQWDPDLIEDREQYEEVRAALSRLSESVREVAVLYYIEEMSSAEVADQLGIATNTVDKRLQRARNQLRVLLRNASET